MEEQRRLVSIVFCDLVGSTSLSGQLDPEALRSVTLQYFDIMRTAVEAHGGVVEKFIGDAVMAAFGVPTLHEDDARRALVAAVDMREALAGFNAELATGLGIQLNVRIGVNTGEVVTNPDTSAGHGFVSGEAVNVAARLEQNAAPGQILVGPRTVRAAGAAAVVVPAGDLTLRGKTEPVTAYALVDVLPDEPDRVRRFDLPFVGRAAELAELSLVLARVDEQSAGRLMTVYGDAGMGKTRLVREWLADRGTAVRSGTGRCRPYGQAGTLAPLAEAVTALLQAAGDAGLGEGLRQGLLLDGTPNPSVAETVAAVADLLAVIAVQAPVVVVIDDCHWAAPTLLDVIEELVDRTALDPVLLLSLARPELIDLRPGWGSGRLNVNSTVLQPLPASDAELLAGALAEVGAHDEGSLTDVVHRAEGNPLHLEHLVSAMVHDGGSEPLPPSVQGLLGARIHALDPAERAVLDQAAVIGRDFDVETVRALIDGVDPAPVVRVLARRRLIEPVRTPGARVGRSNRVFRFTSALIQEVAYTGMAKRVRADRHERLADVLAASSEEQGDELGNQVAVAGHLEAAHRFRVELGLVGPGLADLRARAAAALTEAGVTALARADLTWAADLLGRAERLRRPGEAGRPPTLRLLAEARLALGRLDEARALLEEVLTDEHTEAVTAAHARLLISGLDPEAGSGSPARTARETLEVFEAAGDHLGIARATIRLAQDQQFHGRHERAEALLTTALTHAVTAGAEAERAMALGAIGVSLWLGPVPVGAAIERCETLLREHGEGRRAVRATLACPLAVLLAIQGRPAVARERLAESARLSGELGFAEAEAFLPVFAAQLERLAGATEAAEVTLRHANQAAAGFPGLLETARRDLARLVVDRGGWLEAAELMRADRPPAEAAEAADRAGLLARITAHRPDPDPKSALEQAAQARRAAHETDSPITRAVADLDHAQTLLALNRPAEAIRAARAAAAEFARKEHQVGVTWCERLIREGESA